MVQLQEVGQITSADARCYVVNNARFPEDGIQGCNQYNNHSVILDLALGNDTPFTNEYHAAAKMRVLSSYSFP